MTQYVLRIFLVGSLAAASTAVSGCNSSQSRAAQAYAEYQVAAANNDPASARRALLALVAADESNSEAWLALGRLQLSMGDYGGAYNAFVRAHELDRTNAEIIRVLTQIALMSGNFAMAKQHASDLAILDPGDVWVKLTDGYAALARDQFAGALVAADAVLETRPLDPAATVLKARAFLGLGRGSDAKALLEKQIEAQATDLQSAKLLAKMYRLDSDWLNAARVAQRIAETDQSVAALLFFAEAAFRAGDYREGHSASLSILARDPQPHDVRAVLDLWRKHWPSGDRVTEATRLGSKASRIDVRLVFADFLTRLGKPREAIALVGSATLPIDATNVEANAVLGNALIAGGQLAPGKSRLDAVLAFDPGNATALRGRAEVLMRSGSPEIAVHDAQKLVSTSPTSAEARLLLARTLRAAGDPQRSDRVLWEAFQSIRADDALFRALVATSRRKGTDASSIEREYAAQRLAEIQRDEL